jgi:hypothetical protein
MPTAPNSAATPPRSSARSSPGCTPDDPWASAQAFADFVRRYQEVGINEFILEYPPMTDIRGAGGEVDRSLFEQVATEVIPPLRNKER